VRFIGQKPVKLTHEGNDMSSIPGPAYRIVTPRLVIRCWNPTDAPLLKTAIDQSLEHLRHWMPWADSEPTDIQAKIDTLRYFRGRFDLNQDYTYGIFSPDEQRVLGGTGLHTAPGPDVREIGYWIHVDFINQGLATEVSAALTRVAFEISHVSRVEIHCEPTNLRSAAVPRKLGFTHEATLRQRITLNNGETRDSMLWTLLEAEFPSSPAAHASLAAFDALGRQIL
jgi:RimJ/RimL family protein N-acetyltransferase